MDKQQPTCSLQVLLIDLSDKALLESLQQSLHYACNLLALSETRPAASHVALCSLAKDPDSRALQLQVLQVPCYALLLYTPTSLMLVCLELLLSPTCRCSSSRQYAYQMCFTRQSRSSLQA